MEDSKKTFWKSFQKIGKSLSLLFIASVIVVFLIKVVHTYAIFIWNLW